MANRTLIIGDVHGHYTELMRALEHADYDPASDRLVFLGDYINRGEESREVLDFVVHLEAAEPGRHVFLRGNHEDIILHSLKGDVRALHAWLDGMSGHSTLRSYNFDHKRLSHVGGRYHLDNERVKTSKACIYFLLFVFPASHLAFLEETAFSLQLNDWHLSHAGLMKGKQVENHKPSSFIWGDREWLLSEADEGQPSVVCGHWHQPDRPVLLKPQRIVLAHDHKVPILIYEEMLVVDNTGDRFEISRP
jgi:serine/threonine protein phosphatase 1